MPKLGQLVVRRTLAVDNLSFERSAVSLGRDDDVAGPLQLDGGQALVLEQRLAHFAVCGRCSSSIQAAGRMSSTTSNPPGRRAAMVWSKPIHLPPWAPAKTSWKPPSPSSRSRTSPTTGDWVRNVLAAGSCTLERGGRQVELAAPRMLDAGAGAAIPPSARQEGGAVRADAQRRRSDTADQAAARHA